MKIRKGYVVLIFSLILLFCCVVSKQQNTTIKSTFSDGKGHTFYYHICSTKFYGRVPPISGLNTEVLSLVFDLSSASLLEELEIHNCPAAIYSLNGTHYFCLTIAPQTSSVLEYTPDILSRETALRIMNSIFEYPEETFPIT